MAKKQENETVGALEEKLAGLKSKLAVLESRGPGWAKAITRTQNFIAQVEAELASSGKQAKAPTTPE